SRMTGPKSFICSERNFRSSSGPAAKIVTCRFSESCRLTAGLRKVSASAVLKGSMIDFGGLGAVKTAPQRSYSVPGKHASRGGGGDAEMLEYGPGRFAAALAAFRRRSEERTPPRWR